MNNKYSDNLVNEFISPDVLAMLDKDIMEKRFMMPLSYDKDNHVLTVVTSHFEDNFMDMSIILALVRKNYSDVERIDFLSCDYNNFTTGSVAHASSSSPFGFLVDASALPTGNMNMPSGIAAPTPPDVPSMPGGLPGSSGGELVVLGVLPPDVVIISRGGKSITARTGQNTEFGTIGTVTMKGAYVNGAFIAQR